MIKIKFLIRVFWSTLVFAGLTSVYAQEKIQIISVEKRESVSLHIGKSFYMPGEILWFKAYLDAPGRGWAASWSDVVYVELLDQKQESVLRAKVGLNTDKSGGGSFYIPPHLQSGLYTVVAYTSWMKNYGADQFYMQEIELLNPYSISEIGQHDGQNPSARGRLMSSDVSASTADRPLEIKAELGSSGFRARQNVNIDIQTYLGQQAVDADLSVSVYKVDELQKSRSGNMLSPRVVAENNPVEQTGNLIMPEYRYHQVAVRLTDKRTKEVLNGKNVLLSIPGKYSRIYTGETDANGHVVFYVKDLYGKTQLAIRLEDGGDADVELIAPFFNNYGQYTKPDERASTVLYDPKLRNLILDHSLNVQSENSFFAKERADFGVPLLDTVPFFGKEAVVYYLDDYTRFVLMEEVLREYVSEVRLSRRDGQYRFRVLNTLHGQYFNESPLVLLDGVPISNEHDIVTFDPHKIQKISIVTGPYYLGNKIYQGVVAFSTYEGNLAGFSPGSGVTLLEYEGLQIDRSFYSPIHDGSDSRIAFMPDTRNLLYWNPMLRVNASGKKGLSFYTSDVTGEYVVVIRGRSTSGQFGYTELRFSVAD